MKSLLEEVLASDLMEAGLTAGLVREFRFCDTRKWQADFAYPDQKILIEVEGGQYKIGRHQRPEGYERDCEKYNTAQLLGFRVLRFTSGMVIERRCVEVIRQALGRSV